MDDQAAWAPAPTAQTPVSVGHLGELSDIFLQSHMKSRAIPATLTATFEEEKRLYLCFESQQKFLLFKSICQSVRVSFPAPCQMLSGKGSCNRFEQTLQTS